MEFSAKTRAALMVLVILSFALLIWGTGCSHPAMQGDSAKPNPRPAVPFHDGDQGASIPVSGSGEVPNKSETGLPFQDLENLPVGTLLTVRLNSLVFADHPEPGNTFDAVLDEPIKVDGNVVVPKGSTVSGHVESSQVSDLKTNRGYIRLDLQSIDVGGRALPVRTSSLFTRGSPHVTISGSGTSTNVMTLEKGRRLTFKLAEPVYVAAQRVTPAP